MITPIEQQILLSLLGGYSIREIAKMPLMPQKSVVHEKIQRMTDDGLVEPQEGANDRRVVSAHGKKLLSSNGMINK